jgi:HSP20 family molecular chaperone IbpA
MPRNFKHCNPQQPVSLWELVESLSFDGENPFPVRFFDKNLPLKDNQTVRVSPSLCHFKRKADGEESISSPRVDVYDTPESYIVIASVAGADPGNINVDFDPKEHELVIAGVINQSLPKAEDEYRKKYLKVGERHVGKFERKVHVPVEPQVDDENIKAKYTNGVLKVILPKIIPAGVEKKKIPVSLSDEDDQSATDEEPIVVDPEEEKQ